MNGLSVKFRTAKGAMFPFPEEFRKTLPKKKIAFLLRQRNDPRFLLPGTCVVDFPSWEATCFLPFEEDQAEVSDFLEKRSIPRDYLLDAHSAMPLPDGSCVVSFQIGGTHFLRYDAKSEVCEFLFPESIGLPSDMAELGAMGAFLAEEGEYRYLAASSEDPFTKERSYGLFGSRPDFRSPPRRIFERTGKFRYLPHAFSIIPGKGGIVLADASHGTYRFTSGSNEGDTYSLIGLKQSVFRELFRPFAASIGIPFSDEAFLSSGEVSQKGYEPSGAFRAYVSEIFKKTDSRTMREWSERSGRPFSLLPGEISWFDPDSGGYARIPTASGNPVHGVFSKRSGDAYVVSHNFMPFMDSTIEYFGPSAIDRFAVRDGGNFERLGTFRTDTGYRFTSHRVFFDPEYGEVLVVTGAPNRIFFVRTDTMEEIFHFDAYPNRLDELSDPESIARYLQREGGVPDITVRGVENVDEKGTIFFVSKREAFVYSFLERKILFRSDVSEKTVPGLSEYHANAAHCEAL